jgi:hypothetical protein
MYSLVQAIVNIQILDSTIVKKKTIAYLSILKCNNNIILDQKNINFDLSSRVIIRPHKH